MVRGGTVCWIGVAGLLAAGPALAQDSPTVESVPVAAQAIQDHLRAEAAAQGRLYRKALAGSGATSAATLMAQWNWANALTDADQDVDAEAQYRALRATMLTRGAVEGDDNLLALDARIANSLTRTRRWAEAEVLARATYNTARSRHDADNSLVDEPRTTLATVLLKLGRYVEAETLARASFDRARAQGRDADAAALAVALSSIYGALDRPEDAREILISVGTADDEDTARIRQARDDRNWPELERLTRAAMSRTIEVGPLARLRDSLLTALIQQGTAGSPEKLVEAETFARANLALYQAAGDRERAASAQVALAWVLEALGTGPTLALERRREALQLNRAALATYVDLYGADHPETLSKAVLVALSESAFALTVGDVDGMTAAANRVAAIKRQVLASVIGDPRDAALLAMTEGVLRGKSGDTAAAYRGVAEAARLFQDHALEPARRDRARALLQDNADLFRVQVLTAWKLGHPTAESDDLAAR